MAIRKLVGIGLLVFAFGSGISIAMAQSATDCHNNLGHCLQQARKGPNSEYAEAIQSCYEGFDYCMSQAGAG